MADPIPEKQLAFRVTESINDLGLRTLLFDGNSAEAEALAAEDFWAQIIGKSAIHADFNPKLSDDLQEYFAPEDAPDELLIVSPLHDTAAITPIRTMIATCMESEFAMFRGSRLFLPTFSLLPRSFDALIRVEDGDWGSRVMHHNGDNPHLHSGFTVFRAVRAKLPKDFLQSMLSSLAPEQWETMQAGVESQRH